MIQYRQGTWGLAFAMQVKGSVFPKAFTWAAPCAIVSACLHMLLHHPDYAPEVERGPGPAGLNVMGGFSFIVGFLIVFRSQQAYSRWWEGCTLLHQLRGEWFNAFSTCMAFRNAAPDMQDDVIKFSHRLVRMMSMLYGAALSEVSELEGNAFDFIDFEDFDTDSLQFLMQSQVKCEIILQWVQRLVVEAHDASFIKIPPPLLSRIFHHLGNGAAILNNAKKLNDCPVPFPLAQIITFMLIIQWMMTSVVVATASSHPVWAGVISFGVIFAFWGVHYISAELEFPFGCDANDLPMHEMQMDMNRSLKELMHDQARSAPTFSFDSEKHKELHTESASLGSYLSRIVAQKTEDMDDSGPMKTRHPPRTMLAICLEGRPSDTFLMRGASTVSAPATSEPSSPQSALKRGSSTASAPPKLEAFGDTAAEEQLISLALRGSGPATGQTARASAPPQLGGDDGEGAKVPTDTASLQRVRVSKPPDHGRMSAFSAL